MGTFTAQHPDLLEQQEKKLFFKNLDPLALMYTQLFRTKPSTKAYEDGLRVSTLGRFATKPEGMPVGFDDPVSGTRVRTVHTTYALGFRITMEMQDDELFGIMDQMPADLGDSARDHQERLAWGLINDGFNGTTYTGLEAGATVESLFNTAHAHLKTTTTQSNMLSPAVALSVTGLESLMTTARGTQSDADRQLNIKPTKLLYHQNLAHQAFAPLAYRYHGRRDSPAFRIGDDYRFTGFHHRRRRVGRSQINTYHLAHLVFLLLCRFSIANHHHGGTDNSVM